MKNMHTLAVVALVSVMGCAENTEPVVTITPTDPIVESAPIPRAEIQTLVDSYMAAILNRDAQTLGSILSTEVTDNGTRRGYSVEDLLGKLRSSMFRTFKFRDEIKPTLVVNNIERQGDAYELSATLGGNVMKKHLYVVSEQGKLKMNIAVPGFSRSFRGNSNYVLTSEAEFSKQMLCSAVTPVTVPAFGEVTKSCPDQCGFWSGAPFMAYGGERIDYCDWNSWGTDVWIGNFPEYWLCNDYC